MTKAVIKGTYSDFKFVKSRSVAQVVVEIPIESADHALGILGAPLPGKEKWLAIAILDMAKKEAPADPIREPEPEPKPKTECSKPLARQAGMLCKDNLFKLFLNDNGHDTGTDELTAQSVRDICHVTSRSEIDGNPEARREWIKLRGEFEAWKLPEVAA